MRAVQDVAAGARSDAGEADNVDNDEVIRSYYAAVEKLGPLVRVRVSDMRFSTKFATRSRVVVDNFITRLPGSAEETWQPGTEEHALSGLFASLKIAGWTKEHCGFAMKRKDNEYELVGGNTRYLFLSEYLARWRSDCTACPESESLKVCMLRIYASFTTLKLSITM